MASKMKKRFTLLYVIPICLLLIIPAAFSFVYLTDPYIFNIDIQDDPGVPLFLTPLIEQNQTDEARMASEVYFNGFRQHVSFSGYLTVDKTFNSNLFFWYFPSQGDYQNDPLILWLQGDLGTSSVFGLFVENGPFSVKLEHGLKDREESWTKSHSVLYIDSPVGSGYSFTDQGYAQNQTKIADDLYNALEQFLMVFPELENNTFFIAGQGYACKSMAALADKIYKNNTIKIKLEGLVIENGFCDPIHQIQFSDFLYQVGLIDLNDQGRLKILENQVTDAIKDQNYSKALTLYDTILNSNDSFIHNATGFTDFDNLLNTISSYTTENRLVLDYVQRDDVRAALHVGNQTFFHKNLNVIENMESDILQSVAPTLSELLTEHRTLFFNGQLDVKVPYTLVENFLQNLTFNESDEYKNATRQFMKLGDDLAGYMKTAGKLMEVFIRNAGHFTTADQPTWIFELIHKFTRNISVT